MQWNTVIMVLFHIIYNMAHEETSHLIAISVHMQQIYNYTVQQIQTNIHFYVRSTNSHSFLKKWGEDKNTHCIQGAFITSSFIISLLMGINWQFLHLNLMATLSKYPSFRNYINSKQFSYELLLLNFNNYYYYIRFCIFIIKKEKTMLNKRGDIWLYNYLSLKNY